MYADRKTKTIIYDPRPSKKSALDSLKYVDDYAKERGYRIRRLQIDKEAIFTEGKAYKEYLRNRGINNTTSAPYRHDQNGMIERQWQTQKNAAATTSKHGAIPGKYWDYVIPAIAKTWAVLPLKSTGYKKSPYELREGRKPDVSRFVPLGTKSYVRRYKEEPSNSRSRQTLRPNAYLGKEIGYPENQKGSYYVLLPDGSVKTRYDVVVNQDRSPDTARRSTEPTQDDNGSESGNEKESGL